MATTTASSLSLRINGDPREVPDGLHLEGLLVHLDRDPAMPGVAIAVNDAVVRRALWSTTPLQDGDRVEIITASQGG